MDEIETPAPATPAPLGPGDDDPRSPVRGVAGPAHPPPGPGDSVGAPDGRQMIAPAPPGPGNPDLGPRHVTLVPAATDKE